MPTLAIIHTTSATVEPLKTLEEAQARCLTGPRSGMVRVKALQNQPHGTKEVFTQ